MQAKSRHLFILLVVPLFGIDIAVAESPLDEAMALYRQAIELRKDGQQDASAEKVRQALQLVVHTSAATRERVAFELSSLGEFGLAAGELQKAVEFQRDGSAADLSMRLELAYTLAEAGEYIQAADAIKKYIDVRDVNPESTKRFESPDGRSKGDIEARMHYFLAHHFEVVGNEKMQKEHLERAVSVSEYPPFEALIAMYELSEDKDWRESTRRRITEADTLLRAREEKLLAQQVGAGESDKRRITLQRARTMNELAWLAANTGGDIERAKKDVSAALEFAPDNPGFLDTLARCHFLQGDYENALKYQKEAIALAPHLPQLRKPLREIEDAIEKSK